jgi:hypothetical protein
MTQQRPPKRHEYYEPVPLDFLILELLPDRGMIGGVHWKGRRVNDLTRELWSRDGLDSSILTVQQVASRLRAMNSAGMVASFSAIAGNGVKIWARTPEGTEHLGRRDELLG